MKAPASLAAYGRGGGAPRSRRIAFSSAHGESVRAGGVVANTPRRIEAKSSHPGAREAVSVASEGGGTISPTQGGGFALDGAGRAWAA